MNTELTTAEKLRGLRWSLGHRGLQAFFLPIVFGSFFILYLDQLGMRKGYIGFILSLFPFCGILALFVTPSIGRMGLKRTAIIFYGIRKLVVFLLVFAPWILFKFGIQTTALYISAIILFFAIFRAVAETADNPWAQEYIPVFIWGRFQAAIVITTGVCSILAIASISALLRIFEGMKGFVIAIAGGSILGVVSVLLCLRIPGGGPVRNSDLGNTHLKQMLLALRDRDYVNYLAGWSLLALVLASLSSFVPLFMKERMGLSVANVVSLQIAGTAGQLLSSYLWGWAADRYGGKHVVMFSLSILFLIPLCCLLMPREPERGYLVAAGILLLYGVGKVGTLMGGEVLLYTVLVPPEKKMSYLAVHYAWMGIVRGLAILSAGWLLEMFVKLQGKFLIFELDQYTPLFAVSMVLIVGSVIVCRRIRNSKHRSGN